MISYTQRNPAAELLLAEGLYSSFKERGKAVWLDIKVGKLNTAAMKEAMENCGCVLAIVTGPCVRADPAAGEKPEDNAYFKRPYCVNELRWGVAAGVPIQPSRTTRSASATCWPWRRAISSGWAADLPADPATSSTCRNP